MLTCWPFNFGSMPISRLGYFMVKMVGIALKRSIQPAHMMVPPRVFKKNLLMQNGLCIKNLEKVILENAS